MPERISRDRRHIHLGLFLLPTGSHEAGWRRPGAVDDFVHLEEIQRIARTAERGLFDLLFIGDAPHADLKAHPSYTLRFEPLTLLAALAATTGHIGLGATVSTTYADPYSVARAFASLDHLSGGRAAWNVVTTSNAATAENFGTTHPAHADRYKIASEFVDVVTGLWDCWDDDAVVKDRATGLYIDPAKVRSLDHVGEFFKVKGPLSISRSPSGRPVILQAGGSPAGVDLAARTSDIAFSVVQDLDEARASYTTLKERVIFHGRDPASVTVLPGVMPVVGRTDQEARDKLNDLQGYAGIGGGLNMLSERLGVDLSGMDLDAPFPALPHAGAYQSFTRALVEKARRDNLSLRDVCSLTAAARGHWVLCGSPETIASTLAHWFTSGAADGFNIMPPYFHEGLEDFVDQVIPLLQERGLYPGRYLARTLRERLGLERPAVCRA